MMHMPIKRDKDESLSYHVLPSHGLGQGQKGKEECELY